MERTCCCIGKMEELPGTTKSGPIGPKIVRDFGLFEQAGPLDISFLRRRSKRVQTYSTVKRVRLRSGQADQQNLSRESNAVLALVLSAKATVSGVVERGGGWRGIQEAADIC